MANDQTLQSLLRLAAQKRGLSGRAMGDLAQQNGWRLKHTTVNAILSGSYKSQPSADTIRAIAWLAGVPEPIAFAAAGRRAPRPPFADELPPGVDDLTPKERQAIISLLRVMIAQRQQLDATEWDIAFVDKSANAKVQLTPADSVSTVDPERERS